MELIYKVVPLALWREAEAEGRFDGAPVDHADGFIHFSTSAQLAETLRRHFAGQDELLLVAVKPESLAAALRWEPSRGGDLFPHLYAPLAFDAVAWVKPLALEAGGRHAIPDLA